jgi:hypothetical protein
MPSKWTFLNAREDKVDASNRRQWIVDWWCIVFYVLGGIAVGFGLGFGAGWASRPNDVTKPSLAFTLNGNTTSTDLHRWPCDEDRIWVHGSFDDACIAVADDGLYAIEGVTCPNKCDAWWHERQPRSHVQGLSRRRLDPQKTAKTTSRPKKCVKSSDCQTASGDYRACAVANDHVWDPKNSGQRRCCTGSTSVDIDWQFSTKLWCSDLNVGDVCFPNLKDYSPLKEQGKSQCGDNRVVECAVETDRCKLLPAGRSGHKGQCLRVVQFVSWKGYNIGKDNNVDLIQSYTQSSNGKDLYELTTNLCRPGETMLNVYSGDSDYYFHPTSCDTAYALDCQGTPNNMVLVPRHTYCLSNHHFYSKDTSCPTDYTHITEIASSGVQIDNCAVTQTISTNLAFEVKKLATHVRNLCADFNFLQ